MTNIDIFSLISIISILALILAINETTRPVVVFIIKAVWFVIKSIWHTAAFILGLIIICTPVYITYNIGGISGLLVLFGIIISIVLFVKYVPKKIKTYTAAIAAIIAIMLWIAYGGWVALAEMGIIVSIILCAAYESIGSDTGFTIGFIMTFIMFYLVMYFAIHTDGWQFLTNRILVDPYFIDMPYDIRAPW